MSLYGSSFLFFDLEFRVIVEDLLGLGKGRRGMEKGKGGRVNDG